MPPHRTQQITQNLAGMLCVASPEREMVRVPTSGQGSLSQFRPANKGGRKALLTAVWCRLLRHPPFGSDSYLTRPGARLEFA
jgi:hypothetical protein